MNAISTSGSGAIIAFRAAPRASRTELKRQADGSLRLRVAAPPVDGAANAEIVSWFAGLLGVPKRSVSLASGSRGKQKSVEVAGVNAGFVQKRIEEALQ